MKKECKFQFIIDFGRDLTLEEAQQVLEKALTRRHRFFSTGKINIEDVGMASDMILGVFLSQKDVELLHKRAEYERGYERVSIGQLAKAIIQKSLSEWEREESECIIKEGTKKQNR